MAYRILQHGPLHPSLEARLTAGFDLQRLPDGANAAPFLREHGAAFVGLVTSAPYGADAAMIAALPALRVISSFGVGYDKLDIASAAARGIAVGYTPDVLNDCVADLAFALVLDVARGVSASDRFVRRGDFLKSRFGLATRVSGKRIGILGMGRIGRAIAKRAGGFDMEVGYMNRSPLPDAPFPYFASAVELARWADFLVVAAAGGASTRHLVSAEVMGALGPKGFLVNISRGTVVDEPALVAALQQGHIAGAGLDVYEHEPAVPEALMALDNVVLLPHIASGTHETRQAMADLVFDNLTAYFETGTLKCAVPAPAAAG